MKVAILKKERMTERPTLLFSYVDMCVIPNASAQIERREKQTESVKIKRSNPEH
jgi:hypothetical protein